MTALYRVALGPINRDYYLGVFAHFDATGRTGTRWNWAASLCTLNWMVFRQVWSAALVYVAAAEGLALLAFALGRQFLDWPPGVVVGLSLAFVGLAFAVPGLYGNAILYADTRRRIARALAASRTVPEACALLDQRASTRKRLQWLVAANVALGAALLTALLLVPREGFPAATDTTMAPAVTVAQAASSAAAAAAAGAAAGETSSTASRPSAAGAVATAETGETATATDGARAPAEAVASAVPASAAPVRPSAALPAKPGTRTSAAGTQAAAATPAPPPASAPTASGDSTSPVAAAPSAPGDAARKATPSSAEKGRERPAAQATPPASKTAATGAPKASAPASTARAKDRAPRTAASTSAATATPTASTAAAPPAATPASAELQPVGSMPGYYINVGLFADEGNARKAQARLLNEGLPAFRQELQGAKGRRIRVRVGPYASRAQADTAAQAIRAMALEAVVFKL
jgi:cell division septation protein DedD